MKAQPMARHFGNGADVEDGAGAVIEMIYPATGEVTAVVYAATAVVIAAAVARAQAAWAATRPVGCGRILRCTADLIRIRNPELARPKTRDTGRRAQETPVADWPSGAHAQAYFAGLAPTAGGGTIPPGRDFIHTIRETLGPCWTGACNRTPVETPY